MSTYDAKALLARYHAAMAVVAAGKQELFWFAPGSGFEQPGFISLLEYSRRATRAVLGTDRQRAAAEELIEHLEARVHEKRSMRALPLTVQKRGEHNGEV